MSLTGELAGVAGLELPPPPSEGRYYDVFQNYVVRSKRRDDLVNYLRENGVEILISWLLPMHRQPALHLDHFTLPETEAISREVLSLPMYPELGDEQAGYVIETVRSFFSR